MALNLLSAAGTIVSVVIGVLAAGFVVFMLVWHYVRKKQGKGGCGLFGLFRLFLLRSEKEKTGRKINRLHSCNLQNTEPMRLREFSRGRTRLSIAAKKGTHRFFANVPLFFVHINRKIAGCGAWNRSCPLPRRVFPSLSRVPRPYRRSRADRSTARCRCTARRPSSIKGGSRTPQSSP